MTAPFASPPRSVWVAVVLFVCSGIVLPFGRRNDWLGWVAFFVVAVTTVFVWENQQRGPGLL